MPGRIRWFALFCRVLAVTASLGVSYIPVAADAQQRASPRRIGVLLVGFSTESKETRAFRQGLRDAGYAEGRDVLIEWRSTNGDNMRVEGLAADLVQSKPDVIVVDSTPGVAAVKRTTSTIPVVMTVVSDPIGSQLVANLAHPGGNVTGLSAMGREVGIRRLQLLKDTVPRLSRVAVLWNPDARAHLKVVEELKAAAASQSIELDVISAQTPEAIDAAVSSAIRTRAQAMCVIVDSQMIFHRKTLLSAAAKTALPVIYSERRFVEEGGLMSYGPDWQDQWRRAAWYVGKILGGAKPSDLPIEQPTKVELVVNLNAAEAIGLAIPESVLVQADEILR